jgi:hypothetical protein
VDPALAALYGQTMTFDDDFHGEGPPDWRPLEAVVPLEECGGFMYMGWLAIDGKRLHHYKHFDTRRYLFLTDDLETYRYFNDEHYWPYPLIAAIHHAMGELEWMRPERYAPGSVCRLAEECARRHEAAQGMLAYHETNNGEAPR